MYRLCGVITTGRLPRLRYKTSIRWFPFRVFRQTSGLPLRRFEIRSMSTSGILRRANPIHSTTTAFEPIRKSILGIIHKIVRIITTHTPGTPQAMSSQFSDRKSNCTVWLVAAGYLGSGINSICPIRIVRGLSFGFASSTDLSVIRFFAP